MILSVRLLSNQLSSLSNGVRGLHSGVNNGRKLLVCTRSVLRETVKSWKGSSSQQVIDQAEKEMQTFWSKNLARKSPYAPHILIYSSPAVMVFSFFHRVTGVAMSIVWATIGCGAFYFTGHYDAMLNYVKDMSLGTIIITSCKFVLCYPFIYHYMNGFRHLGWDYALGFPIKTCNKTGYIVVAASLLVAGALAMVRL